jgi:phosphatidylglycerophosphate synthase
MEWKEYSDKFDKYFKKETNSLVEGHIHLPISKYTTFLLQFTKFTPNQITITSFALTVIGTYAVTVDNILVLITGIGILNLSFVLDCSDGQVARLKGLQSRYGAVLDFFFDRVLTFGIPSYLLIVSSEKDSNTIFYVLCIFPILFYSFMSEIISYQAKSHETAIEKRKRLPFSFNVAIAVVETPLVWTLFGVAFYIGMYKELLVFYGIYNTGLIGGLMYFSWRNLR